MTHFLRPWSALITALLCAPLTSLASDQGDRAMAELIEARTNRSDRGLPSSVLPNGGVLLDLQGRYQNLMLGRSVDGGGAEFSCVASIAEANHFFGRNLKSGAATSPVLANKQAEKANASAALHGMTNQEFNYYTGLIAQSQPKLAPDAQAFQIVNADAPGEGFNDPSARPAVGGNPGTTLGQQRLNVFQEAARIWSANLDSSVTVRVLANFNPLPCSFNSAVLGGAGPSNILRDFPGAINTNTFYHAALANKLAGSDQNAGEEIDAEFNSSIDTGCFSGINRYYYGFDNSTPTGSINLLVVVLHELGHGLGSSSFVDGSTGQFAGSFPDVWSRNMWDRSNNLTWFAMSNSQRLASGVNTGNLYWDGPNVKQASASLGNGTDALGRVLLFAPNPYQQGSSVSHFDTTAAPNLLMEPFISVGLPLTLDLTRQQMRDIGWYRDTNADRVPDTITTVTPNSGSVVVGNTVTINWVNTGGFNRNVTLELSTNGGTSFPIVIATDVANTGSRSWVVPNNLTTQARIRVREHDFLAPLGTSSANFTITNISNSAPSFSPVAAITRQRGSAAGVAVTLGNVSDTQTPAASLTVTQIAGGSATGITIGTLLNNNGVISAPIGASCTATAGTVRFQVSDGTLQSTGDLQVLVDANTLPSLGYANQSVNGGSALNISPNSGPSDNGSISTIALQSAGTYTAALNVNSTTGVISTSAAAPIGIHTIVVRATDNCSAQRDAAFQLTVNNTAPSFAAAGAITRQRGSAAPDAVNIGTVADAQSPAASLLVTQLGGGTSSGISVGPLSNAAGVVSTTLAASCNAVAGSLRFQVSDGALSSTADLQVLVSANANPSLAYPSRILDGGTDLVIFPNMGPSDNGSVTDISVFGVGTYTGGISLDSVSGRVTLTNAAPIGAHTITLRATDNCGASTDALLQIAVNNTAPSFTPAPAIALQQGSGTSSPLPVGTVSDPQSASSSLAVIAIVGGTASGLSVGNIANNAGSISAVFAANCTATSGTQRFRVSDGQLTTTADLPVTVAANTVPTFAYGNARVNLAGTLVVNPSIAAADNGTINEFTVLSQGSYTGSVAVNSAGAVALSAAAPTGTHTLTIRATDNCGATTDRSFSLNVTDGLIFDNGFE